jgi:hypothetical protein
MTVIRTLEAAQQLVLIKVALDGNVGLNIGRLSQYGMLLER